MYFVIVLGPGWPRSRFLEGVRSLPAFGASTACGSVVLQGSSCVDFGFPNSLFSFCCTCVCSCVYTKGQPWQSFLVCHPSSFMWDVCTGPFMDIYAHGAHACGGQKIILGISPYYSPLHFLRQSLHRTWSLLIQLLPASPRDLPISAY